MKKTLSLVLLTVAMLAGLDSFAQFNQGRYIVNGAFSFYSETNKTKSGSTVSTDGKTTHFGLTPSVGYFPVDNIAVGLGINVGTTKYNPEGSGSPNSSSSIAVGPFVRYYLPMAIFFQGFVAVGSSSFHYDLPDPSPDLEYNYGMFNWDLGVGYAYFLNDYVAIEPMVGYQHSKQSDKDSDNASIDGRIYLSAALTIYLGERQ